MQITVQGKQIGISDALRVYVSDSLEPTVEKYFGRAIDSSVTFGKSRSGIRCVISVHVGKGIMVQAKAEADEVHPAMDTALEKIAKQLRRYKRRLKDHHNRRADGPERAELDARQMVIAAEEPEAATEPDHFDPVIVAETQTVIDTLSVGEAVMRMDLADLPALMFKNGKHGGLNVVYRRADGNIGWVDPAEAD